MLNGLSLFSGIGGLDVALSEYVRPIAYCEIDPYCQAVILSRISTNMLPNAPIWDDIKTFPVTYSRSIDIIYGGSPCQGFSVAGNGKGLADERSGLLREMLRVAKEIKPTFIFLENVPAISTRGGVEVLTEIAEMGYDTRFCTLSASSIGAQHKRERWFLLGKSRKSIKQFQINENPYSNSQPSRQTDSAAKSVENEQKSWLGSARFCGIHTSAYNWKKDIGEMDWDIDGLSYNVDGARALGNAVVPAQAREAFRILSGVE